MQSLVIHGVLHVESKCRKPMQKKDTFQHFYTKIIYFEETRTISCFSVIVVIVSNDVTEHIFFCSSGKKNKQKKNPRHLCTLRPLYGTHCLQVGAINRVHDAFVR